jgi:hypothetical protein
MERLIRNSKELALFVEFVYNKKEVLDFLEKYFDIYYITKKGELVPAALDMKALSMKDLEPNLYCERR